MSRFIRKAAKKAKEIMDEKAKERQEWKEVKAKIQKEESIKFERQKIKDKLAHERQKAKERLEKGHPLTQLAKKGLAIGYEASKQYVKEQVKPKPNKKTKKPKK